MKVENATLNIIYKDNKPFVRWEQFGTTIDMKVWKAKSNKPYVKCAGMTIYINDELKSQLR